MGLRKDEKSFHTTYDDKILENMKRYYGLDNKDELLKFIKKISLYALMKSTRPNQKVNKDYNDNPVLAQTPETSSSTTTPGLPTIQV
jgi:hypothetical protein